MHEIPYNFPRINSFLKFISTSEVEDLDSVERRKDDILQHLENVGADTADKVENAMDNFLVDGEPPEKAVDPETGDITWKLKTRYYDVTMTTRKE